MPFRPFSGSLRTALPCAPSWPNQAPGGRPSRSSSAGRKPAPGNASFRADPGRCPRHGVLRRHQPPRPQAISGDVEIRGKCLRPSHRDVAQTESGALGRAEAPSRRRPNTAALRIVADDGTGGLERVAILGQIGEGLERLAEWVSKDEEDHQLQGGLARWSRRSMIGCNGLDTLCINFSRMTAVETLGKIFGTLRLARRPCHVIIDVQA